MQELIYVSLCQSGGWGEEKKLQSVVSRPAVCFYIFFCKIRGDGVTRSSSNVCTFCVHSDGRTFFDIDSLAAANLWPWSQPVARNNGGLLAQPLRRPRLMGKWELCRACVPASLFCGGGAGRRRGVQPSFLDEGNFSPTPRTRSSQTSSLFSGQVRLARACLSVCLVVLVLLPVTASLPVSSPTAPATRKRQP